MKLVLRNVYSEELIHLIKQFNSKIFFSQFSHKKLSSTARNTDFTVVLNGEKVEGFAKVDLAPKQSLVDLTATSSVGKSRFYYKLNKKSDRQATCEDTHNEFHTSTN